jgi:hypothetical protein
LTELSKLQNPEAGFGGGGGGGVVVMTFTGKTFVRSFVLRKYL